MDWTDILFRYIIVMAALDFEVLDAFCKTYVEEFYTTQKPLPAAGVIQEDTIERVQAIIDRSTKRFASNVLVKDLNDKRLRPNLIAGPDGLGCLRKGKAVKVKDALLGQGAYGSVYKVDSKTAVKVQLLSQSVYNDIDNNMGIKHRIATEKALSVKAGELGVGPKVYDTYVCCGNDNACYMVMYMELLKGETLSQIENTPGKEAVLKEATELAKAKLRILHKHKILHGDLHNGNVWVSTDKAGKLDVKIIDYGYARYFHDNITIESKKELNKLAKFTWADHNLNRYVAIRLIDTGVVKK